MCSLIYLVPLALVRGGAARLDLSMERGTRGSDAAGLKESYWRLLFSATVLGR